MEKSKHYIVGINTVSIVGKCNVQGGSSSSENTLRVPEDMSLGIGIWSE